MYDPYGSFPQKRVTLSFSINAVCAAVPYRGTDNTERDQEGICRFNPSFFVFLTVSHLPSLPPFHGNRLSAQTEFYQVQSVM